MDIPDTNENLIKIHNHVRQVKASEEIGVKFMQRWEEEAMWKREGREAGLAEGLTKGELIAQIRIIRSQFLTKHKISELIADDLGLAPEFVQQICDLLICFLHSNTVGYFSSQFQLTSHFFKNS